MIYLFPFLIWAGAMLGIQLGGILTFTGLLLTFVMHPILDFIFSKKQIPVLSEKQKKIAEKIFYFSFVALIALWILFFVRMHFYIRTKDLLSIAGSILSAGVVFGFLGINTAHEFIHRENRFQRAMGVIQLMMVNFAFFRINHVDIHHKWVATPLDSSTAKKGEMVYTYWFRSFFVGWWKTYLYEAVRVQGSFRKNRMNYYVLVSAVVWMFLYGWGGFWFSMSWFMMSAVAIVLLLTVDYLEHYGLERKEIKPGVYEAIKPKHSWDSYSYFTNIVLFNLGIHSHHHTRSQLPFTELRADEGIRNGASVLPYGYSVMFLMALIPPWWRKVMG
jgi:alkane 1-monooxygenase